jgi:hypothetical protein
MAPDLEGLKAPDLERLADGIWILGSFASSLLDPAQK